MYSTQGQGEHVWYEQRLAEYNIVIQDIFQHNQSINYLGTLVCNCENARLAKQVAGSAKVVEELIQ